MIECAGDFVAHIKFTVLLMPNGSDRITSHALQELQPSKVPEDPEIKAWLAMATKAKKKGGGKKKKGAHFTLKYFVLLGAALLLFVCGFRIYY
jgi:hypothetical protein